MEDITSQEQNAHPTLHPDSAQTITTSMDDTSRIQFAEAVSIAARKVAFKRKEESNSELYYRINSEKEAKKNRIVKSAAKKMLKKKQLKKMTAYYAKK
jgi:hypothetical protein